jgi:hypothetical protein
MSELEIKLNEKDQLIGAGFYSDKSTEKVSGIFYFAVDPATKNITSILKKEAPAGLLSALINGRNATKGKGQPAYFVRDIAINTDGSIIIIAECELQLLGIYGSYSGLPGTRQVLSSLNRLDLDDVIITKINADGSVAWFSKIPKQQTTPFSGSIGYLHLAMQSPLFLLAARDYTSNLGIGSLVSDKKIFIIFNDHPQNLRPKANPNKPRTMLKPKKSTTVIVTLDANGASSKKALFSSKKTGTIVNPGLQLYTSGNALIFYASKGVKYRFVKVMIE